MKRTHTLLAIGCELLLAASPCFAQMYTVTDLVTTPDAMCPSGSYIASGINASGQVVGSCLSGHFPIRAFRTAANSPIDPATDELGTLGGAFSVASGVNDLGQTVGKSQTDDGYHAFRTAPNSLINPATDDLGIPGSVAQGINNAGQVVGQIVVPNGHAFRTAPNSPINPATDDLGTLGGTSSVANGINALGQAVGASETTGDAALHAFRTASNKPINAATDDLGTLGGNVSAANAINSFGQVVGRSTLAGNTVTHAFRAAPHRRINPVTDDLGTLEGTSSEATGVDTFGQVVGSASTDGSGTPHAFLYSSGVMRDFNNLVPAVPGCDLVHASGINDRGQIAADQSCSGEVRPVVLNPIYQGLVRPPIKADGSSVFSAKRESVTVAFLLTKYGTRTCTLPPATIAIVRVTDGRLTTARNAKLSIAGCRYAYDLKANRLGVGDYRADISIDGIMVGHAVFALK